jgi:hypothetical protein
MKSFKHKLEEAKMTPAQKKIYNHILLLSSRILRVKDTAKIDKFEKEIHKKLDSLADSIEKVR